MRFILISLLLAPALWAQKTEWTVRYVAGVYETVEGRKMPMEVLPDRVMLNGRKSIPVEAITEVAYQRVDSRRSGTWVDSDTFQNADPRGAPLLLAVVVTNELFEIPRAHQHRIHLVWFGSGRANRVTLEASKRDYKALLAALVQVTGRQWKDFYELPPERQARKTAPLDPATQETMVRGVQAKLGRRKPVPAYMAPEN
jgi:hypothetical protein